MQRFVVLILAVLIAMLPVAVSWAEEISESPAVPADGATEEELGPVDDWYGQLNVRSGGLFNFDTEEWTPYITVPIIGYRSVTLEGGAEIDVDEKTDAKGPNAAVLGLTYNLGNLRSMGVDVSWAEHFGMNVGPYLRYEFGTQEVESGFMVSIVDLTLDDGNVDRQRKR